MLAGYTQPAPAQPATSDQQQRRFNVAVEVPEDADGSQAVLIKVNDDRGETISYDETHNPGDRFTVTVTTQRGDREQASAFHYLRFGIAGTDGFVVIATTRPELLGALPGRPR